ncbi:alpha/beta fold hydrolase, partial [bacterium]|nr:alpha/beta fold hydrolase [bacterium]
MVETSSTNELGRFRMVVKTRLLFVLLILSLVYQAAFAEDVLSLQPDSSFSMSESSQARIPGDAQTIWDDYIFNTVSTRSLQSGCEPFQVRPEKGVAYRGVVILLHGFTSCPKQYRDMAKDFAEQGYHVLIPLLPGHGGAAADELDAQTTLPGANNWFNYDAFSRWINTLARGVSEGEVHIGGLCLGGTIAMRAMQLEPNLYARSMLFSPFFEVSTRLLGRLGRLLGRVNDVLNIKNGFKLPIALEDEEVCEQVERRQLGRAGYCRVRLNHLIAVARFAHFVKTEMKPVHTRIQTIIVENDPVAHPGVTLAVLDGKIPSVPSGNPVCVLAASASHSFFSTTDLPFPKP